MAYIKKIWKDYPNTTTQIKAEDLNNIDNGIEALDGDMNEIKSVVNENDTRLTTAEANIVSNTRKINSIVNGGNNQLIISNTVLITKSVPASEQAYCSGTLPPTPTGYTRLCSYISNYDASYDLSVTGVGALGCGASTWFTYIWNNSIQSQIISIYVSSLFIKNSII